MVGVLHLKHNCKEFELYKKLKFLSVWKLMPNFIYKHGITLKMMSSYGSNSLMLRFCTHSVNTSVPTKSKTLGWVLTSWE